MEETVISLVVGAVWLIVFGLIRSAKKVQETAQQKGQPQASGQEILAPDAFADAPVAPSEIDQQPLAALPSPPPRVPKRPIPFIVNPPTAKAAPMQVSPPKSFSVEMDSHSVLNGFLYSEIFGKPKALKGR